MPDLDGSNSDSDSEDGDGLLDSIGDWFSNLADSFTKGLEGLYSICTYGIRELVNTITGLGDVIGSLFTFLLEGIANLLSLLVVEIKEILIFLFVPSDNLGVDLQDKISSKFPFIDQAYNIVTSFLDIGDTVEHPDFSIEYYGVKARIIDFTLFEPYLPIIHTIIVAICWGTFIIRFYKRIPSIIGGFR